MKGQITLCDSARCENGKFYVIGGGISNLNVVKFPTMLNIAILIEFRFSIGELGNMHKFEIRAVDDDGNEKFPKLTGEMKIEKKIDRVYHSFLLQGPVKKPDNINFSLIVNNNEMDSACLRIVPKVNN